MVAAVKKRAACTLLTLGQVLPLEEIIRCRFLREGGGGGVSKIDVAVGDTTAYAVWVAGEKAVGPMDYTPGAMRNARKDGFQVIDRSPMSQGTRAHQVVAYIVFDSTLVMLCDSPSLYLHEEETTRFICSIPIVFDVTNVLSGRVGEYIVMARRKGEHWYVGGLTSWQERTAKIDLAFLGEGVREATVFRDGANSGLVGEDYALERREVTRDTELRIPMLGGGGFAVSLSRK